MSLHKFPEFPGKICSVGMQKQNIGRVDTIQVLRFFAALLVVIAHAILIVEQRADIPGADFLYANKVRSIGGIGVDIFFVISGFAMSAAVAAKPGRDAGRFLAERFARIVPFFWLMCLVTAAVIIPVKGWFRLDEVFISFTILPLWDTGLDPRPIVSVGWTLAFEWALYIVVAISIMFGRKSAVIPIALALTALLGVAGVFIGSGPSMADVFVTAMFLEFAAGIVLFLACQKSFFQNHKALGPLLICAGLAGAAACYLSGKNSVGVPEALFNGGDFRRFYLWGLPAIAFTAGCVAVGEAWLKRGGGQGRIWLFAMLLGDASYSLYLVHMTLMKFVRYTLPQFPWRGELLIVMLIVASIGLGLLVYRYVEQPLLAMTRRMMFGARPKGQVNAPIQGQAHRA